MVATEEVSFPHSPLETITRYQVVSVRFVYDCEVVVFAIMLQVSPPSVEDSQFWIVPTGPVSVNVPLLMVSQTVVVPFSIPPSATGSTVMVTMLEVLELQTPLFTSTL